jgi:hypothetical protein
MYTRRPSLSRRASHDASNSEAAEIILADVEKHGGPGGIAVLWARRFVARVGALPEAAEQKAPAPVLRGQQWLFAEATQ